MAVIQDGAGATLAKVRANNALASVPIPHEGGSYSAGFEANNLAFTNGVVLFEFRYTAAGLALVHDFEAWVKSLAITTAAAAGFRQSLQLFVGRSFTADGTTNRTALSLATNNAKLRTSYPASSASIGVANAAAGITGGTLTQDATPLKTQLVGPQQEHAVTAAAAPGAAAQSSFTAPLIWRPTPWGGPIVLAQNEGLRLVYLVTTAAAVTLSGHIQWSEQSTTAYP